MKHNAHPLPRFNFLIKFHDSGLIFRPMIGFGNCDPGVLGENFARTKEEGSFANVIIHSGGREVSKLVEFSLEEKSIRDWHSSIKICIIRSLTWSYSGLTVGWWFISGFFRATFLPSSRNKRRDSPERGNSLSGRRASPRWRKASRNAILEDSHTGNIHMYMNFSVRGWYECMRTRKCVHFSFFREKRQFVSLSSKRDSYYRDGRERGKKRICISIKFLIVIFLSSCIFFRIFF